MVVLLVVITGFYIMLAGGILIHLVMENVAATTERNLPASEAKAAMEQRRKSI